MRERDNFSFFEGVFCRSGRWGNGENGVWPRVVLLFHSEVYNVFSWFFFFLFFPFLLLSAWYSWMTRRLWVISWKNWWRKITFSWPTKFALICTKVLASSSCLLWSRISARLALQLPPCLDPPTQEPSLDRRKTGGEIGLRRGVIVQIQLMEPSVLCMDAHYKQSSYSPSFKSG